MLFFVFFFNDPATTEIYTLSLHDALPICRRCCCASQPSSPSPPRCQRGNPPIAPSSRSEEHTSELQSHSDLVCRLLLEKKKNNQTKKKRRQQETSNARNIRSET